MIEEIFVTEGLLLSNYEVRYQRLYDSQIQAILSVFLPAFTIFYDHSIY